MLIIDENGFGRKALGSFLQERSGAMVVAEAENATEAIEYLDLHDVDVIIVDLPYDLAPGCESVRLLRERYPSLPVMVVSIHREQLFAEQALGAGANGYLLAHEIITEMPAAIDSLRHGKSYVSRTALPSGTA